MQPQTGGRPLGRTTGKPESGLPSKSARGGVSYVSQILQGDPLEALGPPYSPNSPYAETSSANLFSLFGARRIENPLFLAPALRFEYGF